MTFKNTQGHYNCR